MLTHLRIQNFKSWKDTGPIRLAKLTVFFGANSAGKTSLLQFLLMLKQTSESPDRRRVLYPGDDNSVVELGTFQDLVFEHDLQNKLLFELAWTLPEKIKFVDPLPLKTYQGNALGFTATVASKGDVQHVEQLAYELSDHARDVMSVKMERKIDGGGYNLSASNYALVRTSGRGWPLPPPVRFYGFPDEVSAYYKNASFTSDLALAFERQLKLLSYLGPLREVPKRTYTWAGDDPEHVGFDGYLAVAALLAAADRRISGGFKKRSQRFQDVIAGWLKTLGLLDSFQTGKVANNRKDYQVRVRTRNSSKDVDLPDVGFGVSQALPVVVEAFYVPRNSTVIIEQPELHLHPSVQSELADLFVEAIRARENGLDRSVQFLIESHSEHFLQRLQRRIAEGELKPEDVALYFCEPGTSGSVLRELQVNRYGDIRNWPSDFFGDPMQDLSMRVQAAAEQEKNSGRP